MNYENINKGNGFLGLIFAPMFAGKTTNSVASAFVPVAEEAGALEEEI